jgi:hypothetical protein
MSWSWLLDLDLDPGEQTSEMRTADGPPMESMDDLRKRRDVPMAPQAAGERPAPEPRPARSRRSEMPKIQSVSICSIVVVSNRWSYHPGIPRYPCRSRVDTIRHRQPCSPQACIPDERLTSVLALFSNICSAHLRTYTKTNVDNFKKLENPPLSPLLPPSQSHS